jgi:hypothetical protein
MCVKISDSSAKEENQEILVPRSVVVRAIADFRRIAQQMLTHPSLDQLTQLGLHGPGHEAGVYQRERLSAMRLHARGRAGNAEQETPRTTGSTRITDFGINLALSLCRALPVLT